MDVTGYNKIELAEYEKPKSWARQEERAIYCFVEADGRVIIEAEFNDGKAMWLSDGTRCSDESINAAIFKLILDTCREPASEWYCATGYKAFDAARIYKARRDKAVPLNAKINRDEFMDFHNKWAGRNDAAIPGLLARQLAEFAGKLKGEASASDIALLSQIERELYGFPKTQGWHYQYHKIKPTVAKLATLSHLKVSSNQDLAMKYRALENYANSLYNEYQSLSR